MWALYWWPYAITHGLNPFVSHFLWAPSGVNTAQAALIPTAALLMAPITPEIGPVAAYNVLSVGSAISAAFAAYLLCRRIANRELAAVAGGYLFGFGSYELAQLTGHLNLTLIFPIPLMALVALRRAQGGMSRRRYLISLGLLFVLLAGISTELLADTVAVGFLALCAAWLLGDPAVRTRVQSLISETVMAGVLAAILLSPLLYYALFSGSFPNGPATLSDTYGLDVLNPVVPTYATRFGRQTFYLLGVTFENGNVTEADGYLSVPLIVAFAAWWTGARRSLLAQVCLVVVLASFVLSLGSHLHVAGYQTVALPFDAVRTLPVFNNIVPSRLMLFVTLAGSVGISAWLATSRRGSRWRRWLLVFVGAVMLFPNLGIPLWRGTPLNPVFFRTSLYKHYLHHGTSVLVLPFGVNDMSTLWQAETGFYFSMPEGYVSGVVPPPFDTNPIVAQLVANQAVPATALADFVREHDVRDVIVDSSHPGPWPDVLQQLKWSMPIQVGGVALYRVPARLFGHQRR